tara:strand:+ start:10919 stop:12172 length:1254 start_codon:yes stop_codon:yes gene_type:complete
MTQVRSRSAGERNHAGSPPNKTPVSFDEAVLQVTRFAKPIGTEHVPIGDAAGRVLAAPAIAQRTAPPAAVSAMDGYAVRDADVRDAPTYLNVAGKSFAGTGFRGMMEAGECVRIFTGAAIPQGAERVVMQEDVACDGDRVFFPAVPAGQRHIRAAGSDFSTGDIVVPAGRVLKPQHLIATAAADLDEVEVYRRPRIAILCCGDELVPPGIARTRDDRIPESISVGVGALCQTWGGDVTGHYLLPDDLAALEQAASSALHSSDLVVVVAGASVGERDFARMALSHCGMRLVFAKVAIKPGKPVWLGDANGTPVIGLPGNPTSALVTARLLLAPLVAGLSGRDPLSALTWRLLRVKGLIVPSSDRDVFVRASLAEGYAEPLENQDSAAQKALANADVLIRVRSGPDTGSTDPLMETLDL